MTNIVLARPGHQSQTDTRWASIPPIGIATLAGRLRACGHKVTVVDGKMLGHQSSLETAASILLHGARFVGISAMTVDFPAAREIARIIKSNSKAVLILGGAHANALPERTLAEAPEFDYVMAGECEDGLPALLQTLQVGAEPLGIPGLYRRLEDGTITSETGPAYGFTLEGLEFPAWDLFPRVKEYPVMWERGCPYHCTFCSHSMSKEVRSRPAQEVLAEITWLVQELGAEKVIFQDETFGIHPDRALELLQLLQPIHEKTGLLFSAQTRVDKVTTALAQGMKMAGFDCVELGVESGDPAVLAACEKGIRLDQIRSAVSILKAQGIKVWIKLILGLPGETRRTIWTTLRFVMSLKPHRVSVSLIVPYPGSQIFQWAEECKMGYRWISRNWSNFDKYQGSSLELETISRRELHVWQYIFFLFIYISGLRASELIRILWMGRNRFSDLFRSKDELREITPEARKPIRSNRAKLITSRIVPQKTMDHLAVFWRYGGIRKHLNLLYAGINYTFGLKK